MGEFGQGCWRHSSKTLAEVGTPVEQVIKQSIGRSRRQSKKLAEGCDKAEDFQANKRYFTVTGMYVSA